jgi:hypothetical protein
MSILFLNKKFNPIDLSFVIDTDLLHLDVREVEEKHFFCKGDKGRLTIYVPCGTRFDVGEFQPWFRNVVREALRREAKLIFPERLKAWSERTGLNYKRLAIKSTSSKWGSYSSLGNINLSLYLLLLSSRYVDYTICHELCHSKEMNHGPRFWSLLDSLIGDNARQRGREMNKIVRTWYDESDPRYLLITNK